MHTQHSTGHLGRDLKVRRVIADVQVKDIAAAMGITPTRVSRIERSERLADTTVQRYEAALRTCGTVRTGKAA